MSSFFVRSNLRNLQNSIGFNSKVKTLLKNCLLKSSSKTWKFSRSNIHVNNCAFFLIWPEGQQESRNEVGSESTTEQITGIWIKNLRTYSWPTVPLAPKEISLSRLHEMAPSTLGPFSFHMIRWAIIVRTFIMPKENCKLRGWYDSNLFITFTF